jgi:hypothetical protein
MGGVGVVILARFFRILFEYILMIMWWYYQKRSK